jgi:ABC-2 type transport system permease protein
MNTPMNTPSNVGPNSPLESQAVAPATTSATRPFYWSVRRELWENRSIYIAPLAVAAVVMVGDLISLLGLPHSVRAMAALDPGPKTAALAQPYSHAAWLLMVTGLLVGIFYSLDALHGERRDRSILFWKSLPVSDLTTVLSKAIIPLVVLPLIIFVTIVILQLTMRLASSVALLAAGVSAAPLWTQLPLFQMELVLLYGLIVLALWHAPIYAWLLLVSGSVRRAIFLWAVLPLLALSVVEKIAFNTTYFFTVLVKDRVFGFAGDAFDFNAPGNAPVDPHFIPLAILTPGRFLSSPGLWIGLIVAAIFIATAVQMRRNREPI